MRGLLCHLPLMMLTALLLMGSASCGDEPRSIHSGSPVPVDTTRHSNDTTSNDTTSHGSDTTATDTTHHTGGDTTATTFSIQIHAPRGYGYMGQTLQLTATTSNPATVTWHSLNTSVATIDRASGMVTFGNATADGTTLITAMTAGATDSITLTNRCWKVAAWDGNAWSTPSYFTARQGDTLVLTIVDSQSQAIDNQGFNAASCQWTATSRTTDADLVTLLPTASATGPWQRRFVILPDAPVGASVSIIARYGDAASSLTCIIAR